MTRYIRGLVLYVLVGMSVAGLALAQTQEEQQALEAEEVLEGGGIPREAAPEAVQA